MNKSIDARTRDLLAPLNISANVTTRDTFQDSLGTASLDKHAPSQRGSGEVCIDRCSPLRSRRPRTDRPGNRGYPPAQAIADWFDAPVVRGSAGTLTARIAAFNRSDGRSRNARVRAAAAALQESLRHHRIGHIIRGHGDRFERALLLSGLAWLLAWEWLNPHRPSLCPWPRGQARRQTAPGASRP